MNGQICVVNPVNKGITNKQCSLNILTMYTRNHLNGLAQSIYQYLPQDCLGSFFCLVAIPFLLSLVRMDKCY